ncbi:MAG TPA: glycosyltransferase family 39 protein, partial [Chloroflexia bacterium]|nr:glycosyltransferase family 39 protein [Chloroflexia bacterium]
MSSHPHDVQSSYMKPVPAQGGSIQGGAGAPREEPHAEVSSDSGALSVLLDVLRRVYVGRCFFGGLIAIELAWVAQNALIWGNNPDAATRYYIAATLLLLLSLSHPSLSFFRPRTTLRKSTTVDATRIKNGRTSAAADLTDAQAESAAAATALPGGENSTLPTRFVRSRVAPASQNGSANSCTADQTLQMRARSVSMLWVRWRVLRNRLGWRIATPLAVLTAALVAATVVVLLGEVTSPFGGWLWTAAIISLILTAAVAPVKPPREGLLPDAHRDFFSRGVPTLNPRWETLAVMFILAVSLVLRLVNLEYHPGIFGDEGERGMEARAILEGRPTFIFGSGWWGVPNLYFYMVAFFLRTLGDHNMVADRMLSVLSGVIAVWFVFRTGKLLWGQRAGLIAAALLGVSPLALQFSRLAGESTPTGTLWAIGFFYLVMALRFCKWSDWALSGSFWGFSLYFYAAGKLIIPLIVVLGLYCLVRWRLGFFKRYAQGFVLLGVIFILTGLPYGIYSAQQNWLNFTGRANETSIFTPANQPGTFARYGLEPPLTGPGVEGTVQSLLSHPVAWAEVLYHQLRETTDVLYRRPDQVIFYRHGEHGGSMFPPFWAGIVMLSLVYATWKFWDGRFALVSLWFWFGMLGSVLTVDAPNLQRITGAWPALMLLPAALLDRVFAGAWPLSLNLARRWATVPIAAGLLWLGVDSYHEYFVSYAAT